METTELRSLLGKIELTWSQRHRAEELYTNLCNAIEDEGFNINFYPQGSFASKTAVRPYRDGKDQAYDVDVICEFQDYSKATIDAESLMNILTNVMEKVAHAKNKKYELFERCVTIHYEDDETGASFSIDVIPAVKEDDGTIQNLRIETERPDLVDTSIAIAGLKSPKDWTTNNPRGFQTWFEDAVARFESDYIEYRATSGASVDPLPDDVSPSNLLRNCVKVLKRLRDIYYFESRAKSSSPSIIITTIVAKLSSSILEANNEAELLHQIIRQLQQIVYVSGREEVYGREYNASLIGNIVKRDKEKWTLANPANGEDNVLSSWNENNSTSARDFFAWVKDLKRIDDSLSQADLPESSADFQLRGALGLVSGIDTGNVHNVSGQVIRPWRDE